MKSVKGAAKIFLIAITAGICGLPFAVGLKVDSEALPPNVVEAIRNGKIDLDDPATTLALLQLNAVVGVTGFFDQKGAITSIGIQCAMCHSTVDDSFAPGIGTALGRMGKSGSECRRNCRIVAGSVCSNQPVGRGRRHTSQGPLELGAGQIRRRSFPGRKSFSR